MLPFINALPRNTRLRRLECAGNGFTRLTATRLLAAVRATGSLIHLDATDVDDAPILPELLEAKAVVAARAA